MIYIFLASLVLAIIISVVVAFLIAKSYSMKNQPVDYPLDQFTKLNLQDQMDRFVSKEVTSRVVSDRSSSKRR